MIKLQAINLGNVDILQGAHGLHWRIYIFCENRGDYINVMLEDGDQTKSFRLMKERKLDLLPLNKLSGNSVISAILQTRSKTTQNISVNVTISPWFQENTISDSNHNVLEEFVDKSSPSINYFYTSSRFFNSSLYPSLSVISLTPLSSYLLVNVEQSQPFTCCVVSLQDARTSPVDNEALIKR